jgi:ABC-type nitrate/sulfonate/bicarbonate transport system substrate-binding protein
MTRYLERLASSLRRLIGLGGVVVASALLASCDPAADPAKDSAAARVGWQTAWATQAQLALILQNTDILKKRGVSARFVDFNYGAPLAEAAVARELDIAFVGDQPAIGLLSRSDDWEVAGRLMYFRVALIVSPQSKVRKVGDLARGVIGIPFGASTHRVAIEELNRAGLKPSDYQLRNLDILEESEFIRSRAGKDWAPYAAFASWDHHIAQLEKSGHARVLSSSNAIGVIVVRKAFRAEHPELVNSFLEGFRDAYGFYRGNGQQANQWFIAKVGGSFDQQLLNTVASVEPNLSGTGAISIALSPADLATMQSAADFALAQGLIRRKVVVKDRLMKP